jgi:hypothetical protein
MAKNDQKKQQGPQATIYPAFMPGQFDALSRQLAQGFGGGVQDWRQQLNAANNQTRVQPFYYGDDPKNVGGGNGPGRPGNPGTPGGNGGGPNPNPGGDDGTGNPGAGRRKVSMMDAALPPQMGLLGQQAPLPMNQQSQGLLSQPMLPPQMPTLPPQTAGMQSPIGAGASQSMAGMPQQNSLSPQFLTMLRQRMMFGR